MFYLHGSIQKVLYPERLFRTLTLWTMTVTATVVADPLLGAAITLFLMAAKGSSAA